ncbi:hypothetical protein FRB97_000171 [Tulasnella sp. 331]|nr:hypothetical protein FRB98_007527 [Tulasnella sp. 332]KAG8881119.1 hypothetical protein FRB97_000171 [Tulasnella sp. 331]
MLQIQDDPFGLKASSLFAGDGMQGLSPYLTSPRASLDFNSDCNSGSSEMPQTQIAVSTTFYPGAMLSNDLAGVTADLVIQSADAVFFYCHTSFIRSKSCNNFNQLIPYTSQHASTSSTSTPSSCTTLVPTSTLPSDSVAQSFIKTPYLTSNDSDVQDTPPMSPASSRSDGSQRSASSAEEEALSQLQMQQENTTLPILISVPENSGVVNIVLHLLYGLSFEPYSPQLDVLSSAFSFIAKYGFNQQELSANGSQLSSAILAFAPKYPLEVYTLAAQNHLHDLAVQSSQYTLSVSLSCLADQQAIDMGPMYMKWLFFLHLGRAEALKRILVTPFEPHSPGYGTCDEEDQKALARAWGLVTAYVLSTTGMQNVSIAMLKSTYGPLVSSVRCARCKDLLQDQIRRVVQNWSMVKCTI